MQMLLAALLVFGSELLFQVPRQPVVSPPSGLRVVVLDDQDPSAWTAVRDLGASVAATSRPPNAADDGLAGAAGLTYLAYLTTQQIPAFAGDPARLADARGQQNLAGFYYEDAQVLEGFATPQTQLEAYSRLKQLFPDKLVLYPTRLDPIAWSPNFLDLYFRPEFTDLVTPYYYPVGTTIIGEAQEWDPAWRGRLVELLTAFAYRTPAGKDVLPVLQGYEQQGYPVSSHFLADQFAVYRRVWPNLPHAAVFAWRTVPSESAPLVGIAGRPDLQAGVCSLFASLSRDAGCRSKRTLPWR